MKQVRPSRAKETYDVIVVGGGHAGCEAALAAARMEAKTLLVTINLDKIALMPCNPAVGGIGKGHLVREVDALGGEIAKNTDETYVQIKVLNKKKGPAVQALRAQADKKNYETRMKRVLESQANLEIKQDVVTEICVSKKQVTGIITKDGLFFLAKTVVLATGTFLRGRVVVGESTFPAGRMGELPSEELSSSLEKLGLEIGRFQSATPPRIDRRTIDFSKVKTEPGDREPLAFSFSSTPVRKKQLPCFLTYTDKKTHRTVRRHLHRSPIKTGSVSSQGPRFCPSIDRKVINFPDKEHHPVFIEPEGWQTQEMYLQGLTTALPVEAQEKVVQATPGLEQAKIVRPGYAIEYDYIMPDQLRPTLEAKAIGGLFSAGQINGTSGYEEAAAQGIIAGINAALKAKNKPPLIIDRTQGYIGVLIDDLVTKGVDEPYRMFTSRAEHRLLLRQDNAHLRLAPLGHKIGLVSAKRVGEIAEEAKLIGEEKERLLKTFVSPSKRNRHFLGTRGVTIKGHLSLSELLGQPKMSYQKLTELGYGRDLEPQVAKQVETEIRYAGYIERQKRQVEKGKRMEKKAIPPKVDYRKLRGLSFVAREKLSRVKPSSLGQASRIPGVTPADISVLMIYLSQLERQA